MPTDPDARGHEPNLELPSFGFGRRKKRGKKSAVPGAEEIATEAPVPESAAPLAPIAPPPPARAPDAGGTPTDGPTPARPPARPASRPPSAAAPPAAAPPLAPPPVAERVVGEEQSQAYAEPTTVEPLDREVPAADEPAPARASRRADRAETRARRRADKAEAKRARREARESAGTEQAGRSGEALMARLPAVNPLVAAILTGAIAGLVTVLLAFGAARGCDAIRGADSCGGGLGLLALVAILVLEVLIGASLLKAAGIADPSSTSFLGVGVVATIAMIGFLDQINSPWMFLVIPLMTAASFALSWWITVRFIDEHPMTSEADAELGEPDFPEEPAAAPEQDQDA